MKPAVIFTFCYIFVFDVRDASGRQQCMLGCLLACSFLYVLVKRRRHKPIMRCLALARLTR